MTLSDDAPTRATDVAGIRQRMSRFQSPRAQAMCAAFEPRSDDVLIATYPKCGTTWMQQIVHSLRTRGDVDFEEITEVVPWIELAYDLGLDIDAPQRATPRAFKTHLDGEHVPSGARYIYVIRDPRDVVVSFYHFFEGWVFERGSISLDVFAREFFLLGGRSGDYWQHLASWWPRHAAPDTLMVSYEEMREAPDRAVDVVARFIGVTDPCAIEIARKLSSFAWMKQHAHKFDDNLVRRHRNAVCGLPDAANVGNKVRSGLVGDHQGRLSSDVLDEFDARWQRHITDPLGLADYPECIDRIREAREIVHG